MENLARHFARIVTSPHKQDITILIVGAKGTGKSYAGLQLAYSTASWIAKYRHKGTWQDYFDMDHNLAVIDRRKIMNNIVKSGRYAVNLMDDIGVGWNARKFMKDENIMMNDILELCRVDNVVNILTVMDTFLIDKVPRTIIPYYASMDIMNPVAYMDAGFTLMKVHRLVRLYREGKTLYPYPTKGRMKFNNYYVDRPPREIYIRYDRIRREETRQAREDRASTQKPGEMPAPAAKVSRYNDAVNAVINGGMTIVASAGRYGVNYSYLRQKVAVARQATGNVGASVPVKT